MNPKEDLVKLMDAKVKNLGLTALVIANLIEPVPDGVSIGYIDSDFNLLVQAVGIDNLHVAREYLRACFGGWKDELTNQWYAGGVIREYSNPDRPTVKLWNQLSDEVAHDVLGEKCKIIEKTVVRKSIVCGR